jgi:starch synthase
MKVLMASSEFAAIAQAGNLGENVRTLTLELKQLGHDISAVIPFYRTISENRYQIEPTGIQFQVPLGDKRVSGEILTTKTAEGIPVFLVRRDEYFDRSGIYSGQDRPYEDNSERFIFFAKAILELVKQTTPSIDILHCHDWPPALLPVLVQEHRVPVRTVLTIHNLEYQGSFWSFDFGLTNLPGSLFGARGVEFYGRLNFLKGGILFADAITLPGEPALHEAFAPEHGFGLDRVLLENSARAVGIPFGFDYPTICPPFEKLLPKRPKSEGPVGKSACRQAVLSQLELDTEDAGALVALPIHNREEVAVTVISPILDRILTTDTRLVILGPVPDKHAAAILEAERKYPGRISVDRQDDRKLRTLVLAAADLVLFPGSLGQFAETAIIALRYGSLPIVFWRGGLRQIVTDFEPISDAGCGFVYYRDTPEALWDSLQRAFWVRSSPETWDRLRHRAESLDFSWIHSAKEFATLYANLLRHRQAVSA